MTRLVALDETVYGPEAAETGWAVNKLAQSIARTGEFMASRPYFERALSIQEKVLPPGDPAIAETVNDFGIALWYSGDYPAARKFLERAVKIREMTLGPDSRETTASLGNLAGVLKDSGEYALAKPLYERVLAVRERTLPPDHPWIALALQGLANCLSKLGEYGAARPLYDRAFAIEERILSPTHGDLASNAEDYAKFLRELGDYSGARRMYERAIHIYEARIGSGSPQAATALVGLAGVLQDTGDFAGARAAAERAIDVLDRTVGPDHPTTAIALQDLSAVHASMGDLATARNLLEKALRIRERLLKPDHPDIASTLDALAVLHLASQNTRAAKPLIERSLSIEDSAFGGDHPTMARTLVLAARLSRDLGDLPGAAARLQRAVAIDEKFYGPDHPETATAVAALGELRLSAGNASAAAELLERALSIRERVLGPDHPKVAETLGMLAAARRRAGAPPAEVLTLALRAEGIARDQFRRTAGSLTESEALRFEAIRTSGLDAALTVVTSRGAPADAADRVLDEIVRSRALVLDEIARRHRATFSGADPDTARLAKALSEAGNRLARLVVGGPDPKRPGAYADSVRRARAQREDAERALAARNAAFAREREGADVGLHAVLAALPPGAVLVSFALFEAVDAAPGIASRKPHYVALIRAPGARAAAVVPLGPAATIDALVAEWRREAGSRPPAIAAAAREQESRYREVAGRLRAAVWDPLTSKLRDARTVFVVPEGDLDLVNFATLPDGAGGYLVDDGPLLHYASAERDFVGRANGRGSGLLALGGPDFDVVDAPRAPTAGGVSRGAGEPCESLASLHFVPLPAARQEAEEIATLWADALPSERTRVVTLTGAAAGEDAFRREAPGRRVLHLATHGFFAQERCPSAPPRRTADPVFEALGGSNPLLLTGLAFAGANRRSPTGPGGPDGVMTAEEIGALDLDGVEWTVLSACETGAGTIRPGEGVLGLRRAFQIAGSATLIMSLWSVDDESARDWMKRLYRGRISGRTTAESVRGASQEMLAAARDSGRSTHPFHWGAFVAAGAWR